VQHTAIGENHAIISCLPRTALNISSSGDPITREAHMASHGKSPGHTLYSQATQRLGAFRRPVPLAILTLILVLAAVVGLWRYVNEASLQTAQARIDRRALRITSDAQRELNVMENVLRGASGLLETDPSITQNEWRGYVSHLHLADTLPMVRALGFATANGRFAPISMMTPTASGIPAVGFDLLGDTARHASLDRAAGTGTAALHAIPGDNRVDFELYLPSYKSIEAEGRANVAGFVIAVADVERLFDTVTRREPRVELEVFTGTPATLLYSSNTLGAAAGPAPLVRKTMTLNFGGEPLTLAYSATAEMLGPNDDNASTAVLVGGTPARCCLEPSFFCLLATAPGCQVLPRGRGHSQR
jgi:CHASE1-domain containing sensor protein